MVDRQLRSRDIADGRVLQAFLDVPRERFVPPDQQPHAYEDRPLPIGFGQTISQPYVVALTVQALQIEPTHRVLDVGAGSGYQTAILAQLAAWVYAVERIEALAGRASAAVAALGLDNVTFRTDDGSLGWADDAPFDRIVCGAASPDIPAAWIEQLGDGGRIVAPVGAAYSQTLVAVEKDGPDTHRRKLCDVRFVKLIGRQGWPEE